MSLSRNVHYFLGSQFLGSALRPPELCGTQLAPVEGMAFFCPLCCEVWFRAIAEDESSTVRHRFCPKHSPGESLGSWSHGRVWSSDVPGSLWCPEDRSWNESLPPSAIAHELRMSLRWLSLQDDQELALLAVDMLGYV